MKPTDYHFPTPRLISNSAVPTRDAYGFPCPSLHTVAPAVHMLIGEPMLVHGHTRIGLEQTARLELAASTLATLRTTSCATPAYCSPQPDQNQTCVLH